MSQIEVMYRSHGPGLLRYLQRSFGWCAAAEDLLQETFLRALSGEQWREARSHRAYLFGVARHVGLTAARSASLRATEPLRDVAVEAPEGSSEDVKEMRQAIEQLPEQMRQTLELRLHDELSYDEISDVLEIPVGTVRSRLHTAMKLLRVAMEKKNE